MRLKTLILAAMLLFETIGIAVYVALLQKQSPVSLDIFTQADIQVLAGNNIVYNIFIIAPVLLGTAYGVGEHCEAMQLLLWQKKKKLLHRQQLFCFLWSFAIAAIAVIVPLVCGMVWKKARINWGIVSSYFTIMNSAILPDVTIGEVVMVNFIVQLVRNIIFSQLVLIGWWSRFNFIYTILVGIGIVIIEMSQPQIKIVLNLIQADYQFWILNREKWIAFFAGIGWLGAEQAILYRLKKGKEFL